MTESFSSFGRLLRHSKGCCLVHVAGSLTRWRDVHCLQKRSLTVESIALNFNFLPLRYSSPTTRSRTVTTTRSSVNLEPPAWWQGCRYNQWAASQAMAILTLRGAAMVIIKRSVHRRLPARSRNRMVNNREWIRNPRLHMFTVSRPSSSSSARSVWPAGLRAS